MLSLGGVRICSDGTAELHDEPVASAEGEGNAASGGRRGGGGRQQRVLFGHFANMATVGDRMALEVVREGQRLDLDLRCEVCILVWGGRMTLEVASAPLGFEIRCGFAIPGSCVDLPRLHVCG